MSIRELSKDYRKYFAKKKVVNAEHLYRFCKWYGKNPEQLLKEFSESEDRDRYCKQLQFKVQEWVEWLKTQTYTLKDGTVKKYKMNTIRSYPNGVRKFCKLHLRAIVVDVPKSKEAKGEHEFSQADMRQLYYYGDCTEKALISLAVSLGYGSQDFLELQAEEIRKLVDFARDKGLMFLQFTNERIKTDITVYSVLSTDAIETLTEYLALLRKQFDGKLPRYLWCNGIIDKHIDGDTLNKRLRKLVAKSNIILKGTVRFHLIRKFTYSTLCKVNPVVADLIIGKTVSTDKLTYITNKKTEVLRVFEQAFNLKDGQGLSLNGELTGTAKQKRQLEIKQLQDSIIQIQKQFVAQKTLNEALTNKMLQQQKTLDAIKDIIEYSLTKRAGLKYISLEDYRKIKQKLNKQQQ